MAYITKIEVPEATTKLMKELGFYQQTTTSPNVEWSNLKGISINHHCQEYPRNIDDVLNMVHSSGFNLGVYEQVEAYEKAIIELTKRLIHQYKINFKIPSRADTNLLLQGLLTKPKCVE